MSADFLIITSQEYCITKFTEKIPKDIYVSLVEPERLCYFIKKNIDIYCWLRPYDHAEDGFTSFNDEESYDKNQLNTILQHFQNPSFFIISSSCRENLYWIISLIADEDDLLVDNQMYDAEILTGSEFTRRIKAGEKL